MIRIFREHFWCTRDGVWVGDEERSSNYELRTRDVVQYKNEDGEWVPVPVVHSEIPENPAVLARQQRMKVDMERISEWVNTLPIDELTKLLPQKKGTTCQ